jgi:hypothetical protein
VDRHQNRDAFAVIVHQWNVEHVTGLAAIERSRDQSLTATVKSAP